MSDLSAADVADRIGATADFVGECARLGLIGDAEHLSAEDAERARLVHVLARRGIELATVADVERAQPGMLSHYVEMLYPNRDWPDRRLDEAAAEIGVDMTMARRMWEAAGRAEQGEWLTDDDVRAMRSLKLALDAGFPMAAILQLVRVYADALGRVAEAEARLFHFYVHEQRRGRDRGFTEVVDETAAVRDQLQGLTEPAVVYFHRKGMLKAIREDVVMHVAEDAGLTPPSDETGQLPITVLFVDLASFTSLTEAMGDATAARVLDRFSDLVRRAVNRCGGRVVKQIGDAFMVVFADATSAVRCAVEVTNTGAQEPRFPGTRIGIHTGPVLYREGDYYGGTVNLAARVASEAARGQILITDPVREHAAGVDGAAPVAAGRRQLKGITDAVELFEVRVDGSGSDGRIDPVCGMTVLPSDVGARLTMGDVEHVFCSEACLQRFVDDPSRYGA